jgi:hypothetical protein
MTTLIPKYDLAVTGSVNRPINEKFNEYISVKDFGAVGDGVTDDAPAIQAAMTYCWINGIELYVPGGEYLLNSINATYGGVAYAVYLNNGLATPNIYKPFRMRGAGRWVTKFTVSNNVGINAALGLQFNGESCSISDIGISCASTSGVTACFVTQGAGPSVVDRCWAGGATNGFQQTGGAVEYNDCVSEFAAGYGFNILNAYNTVLDKCTALTATTAGLIISADTSAAQDPYQALSGIFVSNSTFQQEASSAGVGAIFNIDQNTDTNVSIVNTIFGNNGFNTGGGGQPNNQYGFFVQQCSNISFTNCQFQLNRYGNIVQNARNISFTNCDFSLTGFLLEATGTIGECSDLAISTSSSSFPTNVTIVGCTFQDSAGYAIKGNSYTSITMIGNTFNNCANGGLNSSGVRVNLTNPTVGDSYVYLKPNTTASSFTFIGNHITNDASQVAGRYGIRIDASIAVPAAGNVQIINNTLNGGLGTNYSYSTATDLQANAWYIFNDNLATSTPQNFPSVADANAPNSTLYYSSTASKLVWKNSAGVVNALY